ncbi:MAG: thiol-activated cytolysin family protein [Porphyromonas sp.]|nr:thiol-activated cytolysin family protein [Porphyromonas sp.]
MNNKFYKLIILPLLMTGVMLSFVSCQKDAPVEEPQEEVTEGNSLLSKVSALPLPANMTRAEGEEDLPPLPPLDPQVSEESVEAGTFAGLQGVFINQRKVYNSGFAFDELSIFNPSESQIYPGSVFVGSSITNGKYLKLPGTTGTIIWSAKDLVPSTPMSPLLATFTNPQISDYNTTVQRWFASPMYPLSSTTMFEINEISNSAEVGGQLGVGYQKEDLMAALNLSYSHQKMKTHVLVKAVQKAFSITLDIPDKFVLQTANVEDMDGVMPVYVSEVFYGRMGFAVISSNHEYRDVVAALNLNIPQEGITIELENKYKEILDASLSKEHLIGGSSQDHGFGMSMGWEGFKQALSSPLTATSAKPVAYTLRYVHDNSVARVVLTSDFVRNESYFIPEMDELKLSFTPRTLRAMSDMVRPLFVYGNVKINTSKDKSIDSVHTLFERHMKEYVRIENPEEEILLKGDATREIVITRPEGMSMEDFLKTEITITGTFSLANAAGTAKIYDLGSDTVRYTIKDLIMASMKGSFNFLVQEKRTNKREANLVFDLQLNNDIRVVSGNSSAPAF